MHLTLLKFEDLTQCAMLSQWTGIKIIRSVQTKQRLLVVIAFATRAMNKFSGKFSNACGGWRLHIGMILKTDPRRGLNVEFFLSTSDNHGHSGHTSFMVTYKLFSDINHIMLS